MLKLNERIFCASTVSHSKCQCHKTIDRCIAIWVWLFNMLYFIYIQILPYEIYIFCSIINIDHSAKTFNSSVLHCKLSALYNYYKLRHSIDIYQHKFPNWPLNSRTFLNRIVNDSLDANVSPPRCVVMRRNIYFEKILPIC